MGLVDIALAPLRGLLSSAEREAEQTFPVQDLEGIQTQVLETVEAVRDATEQIAAHVAMLETLADSITPLTQSVEKLTVQLGLIAAVLTPMAGAERDVSRLSHLLHHRPQDDPTPAPPSSPDPPS
jgi:hypothetical protein